MLSHKIDEAVSGANHEGTTDRRGDAASKPADEPPTQLAAADMVDTGDAAAGDVKCCEKGDETPPFDLIAKVPPGGLHNPYDWRELKEEHADNPDYLVKQFRLPG